MVTEKQIIEQYFRNTKGIRGTARYFGLPVTYIGAVINRYKKRNHIR